MRFPKNTSLNLGIRFLSLYKISFIFIYRAHLEMYPLLLYYRC